MKQFAMSWCGSQTVRGAQDENLLTLMLAGEMSILSVPLFFFFNDTATTEIYTLSLHDALPISVRPTCRAPSAAVRSRGARGCRSEEHRLNSSHTVISYAVFCLKKKKKKVKPFAIKKKKNKNKNLTNI